MSKPLYVEVKPKALNIPHIPRSQQESTILLIHGKKELNEFEVRTSFGTHLLKKTNEKYRSRANEDNNQSQQVQPNGF